MWESLHVTCNEQEDGSLAVEGVVRAVIFTTKGDVLNVSFGPKLDLAATVNAGQVVEKLPPIN